MSPNHGSGTGLMDIRLLVCWTTAKITSFCSFLYKDGQKQKKGERKARNFLREPRTQRRSPLLQN
uniref:Uncharacterized protein n=1 Tax=Rhizophora mucronata TaxID=61149 RepID=A0A2P2Q8R6_RHIMU